MLNKGWMDLTGGTVGGQDIIDIITPIIAAFYDIDDNFLIDIYIFLFEYFLSPISVISKFADSTLATKCRKS
jgi:hypothetical protein